MSDIYGLLSKHFDGNISDEEYREIELYRLNNPEEYKMLKKMWNTQGIEVQEFDVEKAWGLINERPESKTKFFNLSQIRAVAAAALLLIIFIGGAKMFNDKNGLKQEFIVATGEDERILLEDGSIVYLNQYAQLTYPSIFGSKKRELKLEGEAFFEIQKDKDRPFIVHTSSSDVEVLGTSFNVDANSTGTQVSVATGKVKVGSKKTHESVILLPKEAASVDSLGNIEKQRVPPNFMAWKTGSFKFINATLKEVVKELNRFYPSGITLLAENNSCQFTGTINQLSIEEALEVLKLSCDINLKQKNNHYEIY